jgi:hypothetical protein
VDPQEASRLENNEDGILKKDRDAYHQRWPSLVISPQGPGKMVLAFQDLAQTAEKIFGSSKPASL